MPETANRHGESCYGLKNMSNENLPPASKANRPENANSGRAWNFILLACLLVVQSLLLAWSGYRHGPGYDEPAHLASGVIHWRLGRYEPYRVNPPLVRMVAAIPLVISGVDAVQTSFDVRPGTRSEFRLGSQMMQAEKRRFLWLLALGRWACLPFAWVGLVVCYLWASQLYGAKAGLAAAALWTFSPNILAHAQLVTPDAGAAAVGLAACYAFSRWLQCGGWSRALLAGAWFALALLCKTTWILLLGVWPMLLVWALVRRRTYAPETPRIALATQFLATLLTALLLLNAGYRFTGTGTRLGDYDFVSETLSGIPQPDNRLRRRRPTQSGNRFEDTWLGRIPLPLPRDFVQGIDEQKRDFERNMPAYLAGKIKRGGRWYFYLYAAAIKIPVATWLLVLLSLAVGTISIAKRTGAASTVPLAVPAVALLVFVSSQTGINQHSRYALPALPFLLIVASGAMRDGSTVASLLRTKIGIVLVALAAAESLAVYPHSLSFFNLAVGGPTKGYQHLGVPEPDSNLDWGLDITYLDEWLRRHPTARPLYADIDSIMPLSVLDIDAKPPELSLEPGWYAISVGALVRRQRYQALTEMEPVERFGYTIYLYHVPEPADANSRKAASGSNSER